MYVFKFCGDERDEAPPAWASEQGQVQFLNIWRHQMGTLGRENDEDRIWGHHPNAIYEVAWFLQVLPTTLGITVPN